jgi:type I restriction enzyme S subunit
MDNCQLPKGYKNTEVGVIPEDWEVKRLGEIATIIGGGTPSTNETSFWNGNIN